MFLVAREKVKEQGNFIVILRLFFLSTTTKTEVDRTSFSLKPLLLSIFHLSKFSLDEPSFEGTAEREADFPNQELVAISSWLKRPDVINSFHCHEVKESGHAYPRFAFCLN